MQENPMDWFQRSCGRGSRKPTGAGGNAKSRKVLDGVRPPKLFLGEKVLFMSVGMILIWILVATAIVLLLIMKWKINPTITLCVGALGLGIACNIGLATTAATIGSGFGNLMTSLGLPIGFGIILGELLSECGGCRVIAQTMLKGVGPKMAIWACALSGFILSVPVFFDVAFIILCPLCVEIAREIKKPMPYVIGPMAAGAMCAHHLVPPTPTPMLVPDYFDVSLGEMVLYGALIGAVVVFVAVKIYTKMLDHGFWNPATCENGTDLAMTEPTPLPEKLPSFGLAMVPILLPVVLIILSTVTGAMGIQSEIISFISNKNVAMLIGALSAYAVASVNMDGKAKDKAAGKAMADSGLVMLITGAGGSFAAVIGATGLAGKLGEALAASNALTPVVLFLVGYGIGAIFLLALGSGTTAAITAMTVVSGIIASSGMQINELWPALACLAGGGMSLHHINDSGFWVVTNISGFTPVGGFKTYSTIIFIMSILVMIVAIAGCLILP